MSANDQSGHSMDIKELNELTIILVIYERQLCDS